MHPIIGLNELREQGRMTWTEEEHGWIAAPEEIANALSTAGFEECKRELTTSGRDSRPAGGVWQGLNTRTGSVASAIWVNRLTSPDPIMFIAIDGESLTGVGISSSGPTEQSRLWARERVGNHREPHSASGKRRTER